MTYKSLNELPRDIREKLPHEAQEMYMAVYNENYAKLHAMDEVGNPDELSVQADAAARAAVQMEYTQGEDRQWRQDPIGEHMDQKKRSVP